MDIIFDYALQALPYLFAALPLIALFRFLYVRFFKKTPLNWRHEIGVILFLLALTSVISLTIISELEIGSSGLVVSEDGMHGINMELGRVFRDTRIISFERGYMDYFYINFIGNIALFIPIGFLIPLLWHKQDRWYLVIFYGFLLSLFIEVSQLMLPRGTDIDDIWLNVLGCLVGYLFYWIIKKISPHWTDHHKNR